MANTLTGLIPGLYNSLNVVSRELVGLIPSVTVDMSSERAAKDQTITNPIAPESTAADITPGQLPPNTGDQTIGNSSLTISKSRAVPIRWNGEEQRGVNTGPGYNALLMNQFEEAMRTLCNEVEADLATEYAAASRAYGTIGTTPFGTAGNLTDIAGVEKILADNGAPGDRSLVLNTTHGMNLFGLQSGADYQGSADFLRQGVLLDHMGMKLRRSGQLGTDHTIGTGTGYLINGTPAIGDTTIPVDTGTGTIVAGDIITIAGDTNKYVVTTALSGGNVVIAEPGLLVAPANNAAVTVGAAFDYSMAFSRDAMTLVTRAPAAPAEGDSASDVTIITDDRSGLSFEVRMYQEYRQVHYEIGLAWGWCTNKPAHMGLLVG